MANENKKQYLFQMWKTGKFSNKTGKEVLSELMKVDEASVKSVCKTIRSLGMEIIEIKTFEGALYNEKELKKFMNFKEVKKSDLELRFDAQQKELDELKALIKGNTDQSEKPDENDFEGGSLPYNDIDQDLIDEYKSVVGRKPYHTWDEATIRLKMKDFLENKEEL